MHLAKWRLLSSVVFGYVSGMKYFTLLSQATDYFSVHILRILLSSSSLSLSLSLSLCIYIYICVCVYHIK